MKADVNKLISTLLKSYLKLDPESRHRIQSLQGKTLMLEFSIPPKPVQVQLFFTAEKIELKTRDFSPSDTVIKATPLSFLRAALTSDHKKLFTTGDMIIEGDLDLARSVLELFKTLEIDWEEYLSHWTGDVAAHQIVHTGKKITAFGKRLRKTLIQNTNEYIHEEICLSPSREALQDFYQDVDALRLDTDRLEARIQRLAEKIKVRGNPP